MVSNRSDDGSRKQRLQWTGELRERFEMAVNRLGGADRATPKGIVKAMAFPGLTIYHVKSHLQKYRLAKFIPESFDRGRTERRKVSEMLPNFSAISGAQINEALQLQMEVQRRLKDQLDVQRHLKLRIEAQGRYLDMIADERWNVSNDLKLHNKSTSSIISMPFCGEFKSNAKESGSDSDVSTVKILDGEVFDHYELPPSHFRDTYNHSSYQLS
ncbi:hypothetical protein GIB67_027512 [Kingdonia uniflora]|uniref:Uncharacterized protein n=1 Tax=Kingdonia uniflora TaxID=39325 RepID=A0A7J7MFG6_9MAGN|nr:hypothetical protein GIB67_027512 [Kingdonia uniflora]